MFFSDTLSISEGNWLMDVLSLETFNSVFNKTIRKNEFENSFYEGVKNAFLLE